MPLTETQGPRFLYLVIPPFVQQRVHLHGQSTATGTSCARFAGRKSREASCPVSLGLDPGKAPVPATHSPLGRIKSLGHISLPESLGSGISAGPRAPRYNTFTVEGWKIDSSEQLGSAAPRFVNAAISYLLESNKSCEGLSSLVPGEEELKSSCSPGLVSSV